MKKHSVQSLKADVFGASECNVWKSTVDRMLELDQLAADHQKKQEIDRCENIFLHKAFSFVRYPSCFMRHVMIRHPLYTFCSNGGFRSHNFVLVVEFQYDIFGYVDVAKSHLMVDSYGLYTPSQLVRLITVYLKRIVEFQKKMVDTWACIADLLVCLAEQRLFEKEIISWLFALLLQS